MPIGNLEKLINRCNKASFRLCLFTFIPLFAHSSSVAFGWSEKLCDSIYLEGPEAVSFTNNERVLICGSKKVQEWNKLSESQSLFSLKTFLENRGYFDVVTRNEDGRTLVQVGAQTYVGSWDLQDEGRLDASRFRLIQGQLLTPSLLDSVTDRVRLALENESYGCPVVKTYANAAKQSAWTKVEPVEKKTIYSVNREPVQGMDAGSLRRYDAFTLGGPFNRDNLYLTERRISAEAILQNAHFEIRCSGNQVYLTQKNIAGPPRIFVFGVGVNTEKGPSAKVTWKHLRLGENGSNLALSLTGSFREQRFDAISDYYFSDPLNRFHLNPSLTLTHQNEKAYERYEGQLRLTPATSWDGDTFGLKAFFGPTLNIENKVSGLGKKESKFIAFNTLVQMMQHSYELHENSPQGGLEVDFSTMSTIKSGGSSFGATKVDIHSTELWNLFYLDPPAVIIGVRADLSTVFTEETLAANSNLPSTHRLFLGGSRDLRGFSRISLPDSAGALTAVSASGEVRFVSFLPWKLQPFVFTDFGKVGLKQMQLNDVLYWSPGVGLRWESPIGAFRSTLAKGFISRGGSNTPAGWNLYLSYGEEF